MNIHSLNYSSPVVVVEKKNGELRVCGDFRKSNNITRGQSYTLSAINSLGSEIFSTIDLKQAYHHINVYHKYRKTAVHTPLALLQYLKMPFGLKTAARTFPRFINVVCKELNQFSFVYIDDIIIYSKNIDNHLKHLEIVLNRLKRFGMKVNLAKSKFCASEVEFLGYLVNKNGF